MLPWGKELHQRSPTEHGEKTCREFTLCKIKLNTQKKNDEEVPYMSLVFHYIWNTTTTAEYESPQYKNEFY